MVLKWRVCFELLFGVGFGDLVVDLHDPVEDEFLPLTRPLPDDEFPIIATQYPIKIPFIAGLNFP
jgi:hypothetical protein